MLEQLLPELSEVPAHLALDFGLQTVRHTFLWLSPSLRLRPGSPGTSHQLANGITSPVLCDTTFWPRGPTQGPAHAQVSRATDVG